MTKEQKTAWRANMSKLAAKIKIMTDIEKREYIRQNPCIETCLGHTLSCYNTIFLLYQIGKKPVSMVGGFRQWQKVGRKVIKGQHAIGHIYVPINVPKLDDDRDIEQPDKVHFKLVPMFDVAQTEKSLGPTPYPAAN